jgi:uncharacterized protein (TIGR03437 family)
MPFLKTLLILLVFSGLAAGEVQLDFAPPGATYSRLVRLSNGGRLFAGSRQISNALGLYPSLLHSQIALAADPPLSLPALGGSGNDVLVDAAVDPNGNIWIVGNTDSDDFRLVNPIVGQKVPYRTAGFVMELDPTGTKILFATYLAGQQPSSGRSVATYATALTIDRTGNVYVGGTTDETDYPVTPGAFLTKGGGTNTFGETFFYSFLTKISPAGKLVYSTYLGTGKVGCTGGSSCIGRSSTSAAVDALAVNIDGLVTVSGTGGSDHYGAGYVLRVAPDASRLAWSASVGSTSEFVKRLAVVQEADGTMDLLGEKTPFTPGLFPTLGTSGLFAAKLSSDGSRLLYSTDLGQSPDSHAAGIALDASGVPYLAGTSSSAQFPVITGVPNLGPDFVLRLDATGTAQKLFRFPAGVVSAPPVFDINGRLLLLGSHNSVLVLPADYAFDTPAIVGFTDAASYASNATGLYPGALISLFGFKLPSSPDGVRVLIDNLSAPILYTGPNQINVQVPFGASRYQTSRIDVVLPLGTISLQAPVSRSLGIFTVDGVHAAALNQDGTVNSASNPAAAGSIVSIFGTGAVWPLAGGTTLDPRDNGFQVFDQTGRPLTILYAGSASGNGVFQINIQLPSKISLPLMLRSAAISGEMLDSNKVQIYVQ